MHSSDLKVRVKKCCNYGSIVKSNFDAFLDLVIFAYFNANSIDFCEHKC